MTANRSKIAIIGSGISGLGAAYLLHPAHDVTVYEKNPVIGGHARTMVVSYGSTRIAVDTGFIVYNEKNYPNLAALFRLLKVPTAETAMTFGVASTDGRFEWGAENLNALFGQRRNLISPRFYRLLFDILRFNRGAVREAARYPALTLGQLIEKMRLGRMFRDYYILPMGGAIWSCPLDALLNFPAKFFVDFFDAHGLLTVTRQPQWRTVTGGSQTYLDRLSQGFKDRIRAGTSIASVTRAENKIKIAEASGAAQEFDRVIFACHAAEALALLGDADAAEQDILGAFQQQKNIAYLHKDTGLMPRRKRCWSSWVYHAPEANAAGPIGVTYWMNKLQHINENMPLFVTLNPPHPIREEHILDRHIFYHPAYDPAAVAAQKKLTALQGVKNTWFCGAYTANGFHEDGLASAAAVARQLGAAIPW